MLMKKYSVQWTPGVCVDQTIEVGYDSLTEFTVVGNGIVKDVADYIILVPATTLNATVRIGSCAPGIATVYSETYTFKVADDIVVPPVELTAATGLTVTYLGEEEVA